MLASESSRAFAPLERCCGCGGEDCGDEEGIVFVQWAALFARRRSLAGGGVSDSSECADQTRVAALYVGRKRRQSQHPSRCRCQREKRTNHGVTGGKRGWVTSQKMRWDASCRYSPFAMGNHLSCSLTSKSYPRPVSSRFIVPSPSCCCGSSSFGDGGAGSTSSVSRGLCAGEDIL